MKTKIISIEVIARIHKREIESSDFSATEKITPTEKLSNKFENLKKRSINMSWM